MTKNNFYFQPMKLAIANISALFILGLLFARQEINLLDLILIIIGGVLAGLCIIALIVTHKIKEMHVRPSDTKILIDHGFFGRVRHPVYSGIIYMNLALFLMFRALVLIPPIILFTYLWYHEAKYEESILIKKFGKRYNTYMARTRMF